MRRLWTTDQARLPSEIIEACARRGIPITSTSDEKLRTLSGVQVHQGVVAQTDPITAVDFGTLLTDATFLLALDEVADPQNLGAVIRVGEAAGADGLVLAERRRAPLSATVQKAAAGASEWLLIASVPSLPGALSEAKDAGMWIIGLDAGGEPVGTSPLITERLVLVAGAEGRGLRPRVRSLCDAIVGIPMRGHIESLNVATAVAVAAFSIAEHR